MITAKPMFEARDLCRKVDYYTLESLKVENARAFVDRPINQDDVIIVNYLKYRLEKRTNYSFPESGDIILDESGRLDHYQSQDVMGGVCQGLPVPFTNMGSKGVYTNASGGPWYSIDPMEDWKVVGYKTRLFQAWASSLGGANKAIYFKAQVKVWAKQ